MASGPGFPPRVVIRWGENELAKTVEGPTDLPIEIAASDLAPDGMGRMTISLSPMGQNERGEPAGVFLVSFSR